MIQTSPRVTGQGPIREGKTTMPYHAPHIHMAYWQQPYTAPLTAKAAWKRSFYWFRLADKSVYDIFDANNREHPQTGRLQRHLNSTWETSAQNTQCRPTSLGIYQSTSPPSSNPSCSAVKHIPFSVRTATTSHTGAEYFPPPQIRIFFSLLVWILISLY